MQPTCCLLLPVRIPCWRLFERPRPLEKSGQCLAQHRTAQAEPEGAGQQRLPKGPASGSSMSLPDPQNPIMSCEARESKAAA